MDKPNFDDLCESAKRTLLIAGRGSTKTSEYVKELLKQNPNLILEPIELEEIDELRLKKRRSLQKYVLGEWGKGGNDE